MSSAKTNGVSQRNESYLPIAIVGGGLGGLALAVGLLKQGVKIHIYEAAHVFSEIGAGVAFGPNATRALGLIDERLLEGYKEYATFNDDRERDATFMCLRWGMDEQREEGKKAGELIAYLEDKWNPDSAKSIGVRTRSCIHRARLLDVLVSLIPEGVTSFAKSFKSAEEQSDGTLKLNFADGSTAMASAMIGCDGIKSKTREIVCGPEVEASYVGEYAFRAVVPRAEAEKALGADLARNGQLYCGYGAYIVTYPIEHGDFTNMVAIPHERGESWTWEQEDWTVPSTKHDFVRQFEGWFPPLVDLIQKYCQPYTWALFNVEHTSPYYKGRVCLLGDSAHAATPHMGAGAGMAMEDAYILSNILSHFIASRRNLEDIETAFQAYDAVRRSRTQKLVENSRKSGLLIDFIMTGVNDDAHAMVEQLENLYKWLWHEDLEAQLEYAKSFIPALDRIFD
ncbi:FAD/NAD(P)-binding domain-containing protein [Massarina eburnea CBS 473.64]|uniref:FAD/NAD(P)-binding domain-containing protein n=1 Tax=Massarina eburnea CBS 473.64 TaxID=1395130 RepID=A0A6A6SEZ0_9PLEO|nr:FAD/NAD(P)-binding domain-containing protein [Massarina eburnea CBS 473.64]